MAMGEGLLVQALDALDFPVRRIQQTVAWVLVLAAVVFPITFRHAVVRWSQVEARVIVERIQHALPTVGSPVPPGTRPSPVGR
jgi:hypothetical protein